MPSPRGRGAQPAPKKKRRQATRDNDGSSSEAEGEDNEVESEDDEAIVSRLPSLEEMVLEVEEEDLTPSEQLKQDTHVDRVAMLQQRTGQTKTTTIYSKKVGEYVKYFTTAYFTPSNKQVAPYPITATKVYVFMRHQEQRSQRKSGKGGAVGEEIAGTTLGIESLQQLPSSTSTLWRASEKMQRTSFPQRQAKCLSTLIAECETLKRLGKELLLGELKKLKH